MWPIRICKLHQSSQKYLNTFWFPFFWTCQNSWMTPEAPTPPDQEEHSKLSHHSCDVWAVPSTNLGGVPAQCQIFSDLLHILKDSTKTQIMRTFFPFCPQEYEGAPFSVMLGQQKCSEWRDKQWHHLCIEAAGPPQAVPKGHHRGSTWSESLLDARACCFLLWWIIKNSHTSSPILCESLFAMWLCCSYHQWWSLIFPSFGSRFGHMTCFDHWTISKCDASRGLRSVCTPELALLLPGTLPCHMNKPGLAP